MPPRLPKYTQQMDRVRFGRAIGIGTREAARALMQAADAAASPDPNQTEPSAAHHVGRTAGQTTVQATRQVRATTAGVKEGSKRLGGSFWGRLVKLSGVLWLEVTGVFFGLFALTAAVEVWKHHRDLATPGISHTHLFYALAMLVVFGWFTISSFLNASRRGRR